MFKNLIPWSKLHDTDLVEVDPKTEVAQFRANFDKMLERIWSGDWEDAWNSGWGCEVQDGEGEIVVRTEAPGFEPDEFDVQLSGNRLVVQAEHKTAAKKGNGTSSRYGKLYRAMTVPSGIEAGKIEANYKNGVYRIVFTKNQVKETHARLHKNSPPARSRACSTDCPRARDRCGSKPAR